MENLPWITQKRLVVYGTGLAANMVFKNLREKKIDVAYFLDGDKSKIGSTFCGKTVKGLDSVNSQDRILIAANPRHKIHERLNNAGLTNWKYVDPEYIRLWNMGWDCKTTKDFLTENADNIRIVYNMLEDEMSKKVMDSILQHRLFHNLDLINEIYNENQYFGNDVVGNVEGNIVDCGAYTGDTLKRYIKQSKKADWHYYALEAEKKNCDVILDYCHENDIKNVEVFNCAAYEKEQMLYFNRDLNDEKVAGKVSSVQTQNGGVAIKANSIDNLFPPPICINLITMDIEGAEPYALKGAVRCITSYKPILAISVYHEINHMWEIPLLIKKINPHYRIFLRHHRWNLHDTVCYAISE